MATTVKLVYLSLVVISLFSSAFGQACEIEGNVGFFFDVPQFRIEGPGQSILEVTMVNTVSISRIPEQTFDKYADVTFNQGALQIQLSDAIANYVRDEQENAAVFQIVFTCGSGSTSTFYFNILIEATNDNDPVFSQSNYEFELPLPLPKNFNLNLLSVDIYATDIDLDDNKVMFSSENSYFEIQTVGRSEENKKIYTARVVTLQQILTLDDGMSFEITATDMAGRSDTAMLTFKSDGENLFEKAPSFYQHIYNFAVDETGDLVTEPLRLTGSYGVGEIEFVLLGDDSSFFTLQEIDANSVYIILSHELTEEELKERDSLSVSIYAMRTGSDPGLAAIFVTFPDSCPEVTTTTPSDLCEILACPDDDGPVFNQKLYTFRIYAGTTGVLGSVTASIEDTQALETLEYHLNYVDGPSLAGILEINKDNGEITLLDELSGTETNIEVVASVSLEDETKVGLARISIIVDKNEMCSTTPVEKTLSFIHIRENEIYNELFDLRYNDCEYELLSVIPNDQEYLSVNGETMQLTSMAIDRESDVFSIMTEAQIQAKLKLICPNEEEQKRRMPRSILADAIEDFEDNVFTNEITFSSDITILNIFIDDVNDNAPVFVHPAENPYIIGYPEADLVDRLLLPYLIQVYATDADKDPQITYHLDTNSDFGIESISGIIYPFAHSLSNDQLSLYVHANDGQFYDTREIIVKKLKVDNLAILYVQDSGYHEVDDVVNFIREQTNVNVKVLQSATVPKSSVTRSLRRIDFGNLKSPLQRFMARATADATLKLIIYGLDDEDNLISDVELKAKIEEIDQSSGFSITSIVLSEEIEVVTETSIVKEVSTGLIVGISILGVLVIVLLVIGFIGWWFWIRPTEWKTVEEISTGSETNLAKDFDQQKRDIESDTIPQVLSRGSNEEPSQLAKNMMMDSDTLEISDPSPPKERKKSITFNENVERIEIETEVPVSAEESYKF